MRSAIPYLLAYLPLFIISILLSYLRYQWKMKKYKRIFFKTLRREGLSHKMAYALVKEIKILRLRDFFRNGNMRSIW